MLSKINTPSKPTKAFTFPKGDVEITVLHNGEVVKGYVASDAMARANLVWKKFIFPPWSRQRDVTDGNPNNNREGRDPVNPALVQEGQDEVEERFRRMTIDGREDKRYPIATLDFRDDDREALLLLLRLREEVRPIKSEIAIYDFRNFDLYKVRKFMVQKRTKIKRT
jgi:hypothetical protein